MDNDRFRLESLLKRRKALQEDYTAVSDQAINEINPANLVRLERQIADLELKLQEIQRRIDAISGKIDPPPPPPDPPDSVQRVRDCTVRVVTSGEGSGTAFFVATGLLLTCAHVVRSAYQGNGQITITELTGAQSEATIKDFSEDLDIAFLHTTSNNRQVVRLADDIRVGDECWMIGYEAHDTGYRLTPVALKYEGEMIEQSKLFLKLSEGEVRPGMSGSALLNRRTGSVVGVMKRQRAQSGGHAIPMMRVFDAFPWLRERNGDCY